MAAARGGTFTAVEVQVDASALERAIREAFDVALGEGAVVDVHVSQFPYEYGALVLLRDAPSAVAAAVALEQEERFRTAGIRVGILVRKARGEKHV